MQGRFFEKTIVYVLVGFLPVAANFFLAPVYTHFLRPEAYALIGIATLFQTFLTFFLSFSLDGAFSRLFFDYEHKKVLKHALFSTLLLTVILLTSIAFFFLAIFGDRFISVLFTNNAFRFSNLGAWVHGTTAANVIFVFFTLLYRNEGKVGRFVLINVLFFFIPVAGTLGGLIFWSGAEAAIIGRAIGSIVVITGLLLVYFSRHKPVFKYRYAKQSLRYSMPLIPYQIMFAAFSNIDRIFLERSFSPHDFGVYNFAVMVAGVIPVYLNAVTNATSPAIYRELANGKDFELVRKYNTGIILSTLAVICLCMAGIVPAMRLFINSEYADSYPYVAILFLSFVPYVHYIVYATPLFYHGNTKPFPVISFFALVAGILFNYLFIPFLGVWAVCLSLYVIRVVQMTFVYFFLRHYGYQRLNYVGQKKELRISIYLFVVYNFFLIINVNVKVVREEIVNLIPLCLFALACMNFYNKDLNEWWRLFSSGKKAEGKVIEIHK